MSVAKTYNATMSTKSCNTEIYNKVNKNFLFVPTKITCYTVVPTVSVLTVSSLLSYRPKTFLSQVTNLDFVLKLAYPAENNYLIWFQQFSTVCAVACQFL